MDSNPKQIKILKQLYDIYDTIPAIYCKHCHSCDGPIIWFKPEEINIKEYLKQHHQQPISWTNEEFQKHHMRCPYLRNNRCFIYPVRPLVCRLQGTISELPCHQGVLPVLSENQLLEIKNKFNQLLKKSNGFTMFFSTRRYLP